MQVNNTVFRGLRTVQAIVVGVVFMIGGGIFVGIAIYLLINPSANSGNSNPALNWVFLGAGALLAIIGLIMIIRAVKNRKRYKPLTEEEVKANEASLHAGEPEIENLTDTKLFFHFGGKLNQSFFIEDKNNQPRYEIKLKKFNPIGADTFEFNYVGRNFTKVMKISKPFTASSNSGIIYADSILSSHFNIDGVQCWDYMRQRGYEIKAFVLEKPFARYELHKFGKLVANIVPCNVKDPFNENSKNLLRFGRGVFRIEIIDCRLDDAAMAAFIITRTELVQ